MTKFWYNCGQVVLLAIACFAIAAVAPCSMCVTNAINPNCGTGGNNLCTMNSGTDCGTYGWQCLQWLDLQVDSCHSSTANNCKYSSTQIVTCSLGKKHDVCQNGSPPNYPQCWHEILCPYITLTLPKCTGNDPPNPECG